MAGVFDSAWCGLDEPRPPSGLSIALVRRNRTQITSPALAKAKELKADCGTYKLVSFQEQLGEFLSDQSAHGRRDSEGVFTLAADADALRKMADFSLPFEGAWAVKIVQAACSLPNRSSISVVIGLEDIRFSFTAASHWTSQTIEQAFLTLEPTRDRGLDYLVTGLRYLGLRNSQVFQIRFPHAGILTWKGQSFEPAPTRLASGEQMEVVVVHSEQARSAASSWQGAGTAIVRENRDVHQALCEHCFVCPIPLKVDGRRIDDLYARSANTVLDLQYGQALHMSIAAGFLKANLEEWMVSPNTFASSSKPVNKVMKELVFQGIVSPIEPVASTDLAYHLVADMAAGTDGSLFLKASQPILYWIKDGVVVETESLSLPDLPLSLSLFASAESLQTDLTGFQLRESPEKSRRQAEILRQMGSEIRKFEASSIENVEEQPGSEEVENKMVRFLFGAALAAPFLWILPVAPVVKGLAALASGVALSRKSGEVEVKLPNFQEALIELKANWPDDALSSGQVE